MTDKTILVTGAASGIGAAVALTLAADNLRLIVHTGSNQAGLDAVAAQCRAAGSEVVSLVGDLSDAAVGAALVECCRQSSDSLEGLVLNAGFPDWRAFESLDLDGFDASLGLVTRANFRLLTELAPQLRSADCAKIIGISSFLAHKFKVGTNIVPASSAAKSALEALIKSFAAQYAADGICANVIVPGYIKKNAPNHAPPDQEVLRRILGSIPAGRLGLPHEVADLVAFLLSDRANYITGQSIHIDGGLLLQ